MQGFLRLIEKKQWNKDYIKKYYIRLNSSHKNAKIINGLDKLDNLFSLFKKSKERNQTNVFTRNKSIHTAISRKIFNT